MVKRKKVLRCEKVLEKIARRSLVTNKYIKKGEIITNNSLTPKRPGSESQSNIIDYWQEGKKKYFRGYYN